MTGQTVHGTSRSYLGSIEVSTADSVNAAGPDKFAAQVGVSNIDLPCAKIYDSGYSKHLSPYCDTLKNFVKTPPKLF